MRKKTAILLGLISTLVIIIPVIVYAQMVKQAECCRLSQNIKMDDVTYGCTDIVAGHQVSSGTVGHCDVAGDDEDCTFITGTTTFKKATVVGAGDCQGVGGSPDTCELKGIADEPIEIETQEWGTICLLNSVYNITNWIFFFFMAIAILVGVLAAYMFMTAAGDPGKVSKARDLLLYMTIGLIIAAVAKVIPTLVRTIVGF